MRRIGILGGGQLGRMLALAGYPLGLEFRFLDPNPDCPAAGLGELICGAYDDADALERFVDGVDLVTYEFENVPVAAAQRLAARLAVYPGPLALEVAQDRLREKSFLRQLGIPTVEFAAATSLDELQHVLGKLSLPAIVKSVRQGYDGRGQAVVRSHADAAAAWQRVGRVPVIVEQFAPFVRELSSIVVRGRDGSTRAYPLVENHHEGGILRTSRAPAAGVSPALEAMAEDCAQRLLDALSYVGVLTIEWFELADGSLVANEIAPRVHNSGHWSIEAAETSQFENHLRAVCGWPLGSTAAVGQALLVNLIGSVPDTAAVLRLPDTHLHLYGKDPRPGRKLGHITLRAADSAQLNLRREALAALDRQPSESAAPTPMTEDGE